MRHLAESLEGRMIVYGGQVVADGHVAVGLRQLSGYIMLDALSKRRR